MRRSSNPVSGDLQAPLTDGSLSRGVRIPSPNVPYDSNLYSRWNSAGAATLPSGSPDIHRTRSASFSARVRGAGGVNSFDNFARSWQRAACFPEVLPRRPSLAAESDDEWAVRPSDDESQYYQAAGLEPELSQPLLHAGAGVEYENERANLDIAPNGLSSAGVFGTSYGTISRRVSDSTRSNAIQLHSEQETQSDGLEDYSRQPLLVKQAQNCEGMRENVVVGHSTVPQTVCNSVNVLIGVGLLSLPLAMKQAGWFLGLLFLIFAAAATAYTAKILARCLDVDPGLVTYADLAYVSFGRNARLVISLLFCLELLGACVALVVLFGDSLHALIPGFSTLHWKVVCGIVLLPLHFVPLRLLSVTSVLGIVSCTAIVLIIFVDGLLKPSAPGSLHQPFKTSLFPDTWATVPLSLGLIMSPWGGHGVFPNIYRDMTHPEKYGQSLWSTYIFTFSLDCSMAIIGWLMFGDSVRDEITGNILVSSEYPRALSLCIIVFISIIPITKVPLSSRPLVITAEVLCGLGLRPNAISEPPIGIRDSIRQSLRILIRILVVVVIVLMAIVFPSFDRIMALMGSALCFTICIILPLAFYLKIFGKEISLGERILDWFLLVTSSVLAIIGTVWAFLPRSVISQE